MRASRVLQAVDSHTEGMPTRVVTGGVGTIPGQTMLERRVYFESHLDDVRTLLMYEPRGHRAMSGAILQPPTRPDADWGVLFIEVTGCLAMCGHGTIGVATVLVETGMVEPVEPTTRIRLDTPAGLVTVDVRVRDGRAEAVTFRNVPSFVAVRDATIDVGRGIGTLPVDIAYGGNFYAILPASALGLSVDPALADTLIQHGLGIMDAVNEQMVFQHPEDPRIRGCRHVLLTDGTSDDGVATGTVVIHPGWLDRSPCGTGTSARMALLHARGELSVGEDFPHESIIGSRFVGRVVDETTVGGRPGVVPTVTGRAWVTGMGQYLLDPTDPYPAGLLIGSRHRRDASPTA